MTTAAGFKDCCRRSRACSCSAAAIRGMPAARKRLHSSSSPHSQTGRRNTAPMVARTVLGAKGSAQWLRRNRPSAPKASAVRQMVPTLPGSCSPSSTRYLEPVRRSGGATGGIRHTKSTPWGVFVSPAQRSSSSGT
ncbi:hypothetical protein SDC9_180189 [bioreactor metagenome]|uniref:Uncharacterized protein n=1 Tax=bioreactor metagenome TaxID=1076179 RepID=A0A645H3Y2_9ZZZZ